MSLKSSIKISIITVTYNSIWTLEETLNSVKHQTYPNIEHIIIDGASTDGSFELCKLYPHISYLVSEKDSGIYDALNKGIQIATGDIVGILNSDDTFANNKIIDQIANEFFNNSELDAIIGDVNFVSKNKIVRRYSSSGWTPSKFKFGIMPPHPSFYCKKALFYKYGLYNMTFKIAGDFELLLRFILINKINFKYLSIHMVDMKIGGLSTSGIRSNIVINKEIIKAFKLNSIKINYFFLLYRYISKLKQLHF
jgi:glycosyltransferase involved in cell wall biosynthesis